MAIASDDTLSSYSINYRPINRSGGQDYHRFLPFLKYLSFVCAAALLLGITVWSNWQENSWQALPEDNVNPSDLNLTVKNARYAGLDANKLPFTITADEVVQDKKFPDDLIMISPQADILLNDGKWILAKAENAVMENATSRLLLDKNVNIHFSSGYELQTQEARFNTRLGIILGDKPISAQGININFKSEGFRLHNSGNTLDFIGPAHLEMIKESSPIDIHAEEILQWRRGENKYLAKEKAKIITSNFHLNADKVEIFYQVQDNNKQQLQWIKAGGNVRLDNADGTIHSDAATYQIAEQKVHFSGKEVYLNSNDVMLVAYESLEYYGLQETAVARGKAYIKNAEGETLQADLIQTKFSYIDGVRKIISAAARDNVFIDTGDSQISGDDGHYDFLTQQGRICGNATIAKDGNVIKGDCASIDMQTGNSYIEAQSNASGESDGRIRGTFEPAE